METIQVPINRRMDKHTIIYTYNEMLLRKKNESLIDPTTWLNLKHFIRSDLRSHRKVLTP